MDTPNAENSGVIFIVLADSTPHILDSLFALWTAIAQTPSDIPIACGNNVFVNIST